MDNGSGTSTLIWTKVLSGGIWTAPLDAALKHDIEMSMAAGYDGNRLHQKVFEPRFLYWADKSGYLVLGEFSDWGFN